jgi:hypothetical protein
MNSRYFNFPYHSNYDRAPIPIRFDNEASLHRRKERVKSCFRGEVVYMCEARQKGVRVRVSVV